MWCRRSFLSALLASAVVWGTGCPRAKRNKRFRVRIPAFGDYRGRYPLLYRLGALANYWNFNVYDALWLQWDRDHLEGAYYKRLRDLALGRGIRLDPDLESASPRFARLAWGVGESFMWTHHLHENAFDAYAGEGYEMDARSRMVEHPTDIYLRHPRALAPIELPMERIEQLPYHGAFARRYPNVNGLIWAGHWLHAGVYDGLLEVVAGRQTPGQMSERVHERFVAFVENPPEAHPHFTHLAPAFTELHPRAAAIFANMHMLHDMVADILADPEVEDKRAVIFEARDMMRADLLEVDDDRQEVHHG